MIKNIFPKGGFKFPQASPELEKGVLVK